MKKLLNTLYVTTPESYISKDGENIVVSLQGKEVFRVPIINIGAIITFGYQGASPGAMQLCARNGVSLSFHHPNGRFIARIKGPVNGNILLRKRQFQILEDMPERQRLASRFIYGKLFNSRSILRRFLRDYPDNPNCDSIGQCADMIKRLSIMTDSCPPLDTLRGIEGEAAVSYFSAFRHLILNPDPAFNFSGRYKRPPTDPVNAMLSLAYSMLANDCAAALEGVGLDPAAGFMHTLRPGRNSLALDLMEEMRGYMVDRFVISLINTRQVSKSDFKIHTDTSSETATSVLFTDNGLKKFLGAWQNRKKTEFIHPFLNEKIKLGLLPHIQAMLLARNLRGDIDDYPVFLLK
ncbi:MAG: type I-C CRISPR-associated endonuclease Cas1c [Muribaculaceae bacterium]|nr:type I-C CRISPR-associated endonuclease Cas1c [Muribaculaceae bacterium]